MKGDKSLGELFDRIQNELIQQISIEDAEYLLHCMSLHPTQFIISFRNNVKEELIRQNVCPECHNNLVDKACRKCKILWEESI